MIEQFLIKKPTKNEFFYADPMILNRFLIHSNVFSYNLLALGDFLYHISVVFLDFFQMVAKFTLPVPGVDQFTFEAIEILSCLLIFSN